MPVRTITLKRARSLRRQLTPPEVQLWQRLRGREKGKPAFRRQHPIGPYILDFYCAQARLAVEIDGQGHGFGDRPQKDARRDAWLREQGIRVVRLVASEFARDPDGFAWGLQALATQRIEARLSPSTASRSPSPVQTGEDQPA